MTVTAGRARAMARSTAAREECRRRRLERLRLRALRRGPGRPGPARGSVQPLRGRRSRALHAFIAEQGRELARQAPRDLSRRPAPLGAGEAQDDHPSARVGADRRHGLSHAPLGVRRYRRMADMRQIVLLRGINIGPRNRVAMPALRSSASRRRGFEDVRTYVQSGNVVLDERCRAATRSRSSARKPDRGGVRARRSRSWRGRATSWPRCVRRDPRGSVAESPKRSPTR